MTRTSRGAHGPMAELREHRREAARLRRLAEAMTTKAAKARLMAEIERHAQAVGEKIESAQP